MFLCVTWRRGTVVTSACLRTFGRALRVSPAMRWGWLGEELHMPSDYKPLLASVVGALVGLVLGVSTRVEQITRCIVFAGMSATQAYKGS